MNCALQDFLRFLFLALGICAGMYVGRQIFLV
jgi:hypothetical protein